MDDKIREMLREKEQLWRDASEDIEPDAPDVVVMGSTQDMLNRGVFFDRDWQPHEFEKEDVDREGFEQWQKEQKSLPVKATPKQLRRGERWADCAIFFLRWNWVPFFTLIGNFCMRRAFFFSDGKVPVTRDGKSRDDQYLRRPRE